MVVGCHARQRINTALNRCDLDSVKVGRISLADLRPAQRRVHVKQDSRISNGVNRNQRIEKSIRVTAHGAQWIRKNHNSNGNRQIMKVRSLNSIILTGNRAGTLVTVLASALLLIGAGWAQAVPMRKLTSEALGLGNSDINKEKTVNADMPGKLITSSTTGEGSILTIQESGLAGPGTGSDPLWVTVTAKTRLDTVNYPWAGGDPRDYQAGVIYISKESSDLPDGAKEGLGVRAFKVDSAGMRTYKDGLAELIEVEGSKPVSGGTGPDTFDPLNPNGAPHVDEVVKFDFNPLFNVDAMSVKVLLSEIKVKDGQPGDLMLDLYIKLTSGVEIDLDSLKLSTSSIFEQVDLTYDKLWELNFSAISGLGAGDFVDYFEILAIDPLIGGQTRATAEHFLITGFTAVPEPATIALLGLGSLVLIRKRANERRK